MTAAPSIDLSVPPESQRDAVLAVLRERDALRETNRRLEHLIAELNRGMGPGQRHSTRLARSAPFVAAFGERLQLQRRRVSVKSRLGEKLAYTPARRIAERADLRHFG
ncbi:hypothetical protein [Paracoccus beibuensis]|uniref:hypothetical protein n=1 Tax=Paracoccus beibuensis TaxID=547602 RepID=UPI00223F0B68|nr:hypothetical protein [Paracoccus beibuensis]